MLFSKAINTKRDHFVEMKSAISDAINIALKAGVPPLAIQRALESHAADFRRADAARIERLKYSTPPQYVATENGIKTVDPYAEQAKAEEARNARELKRQQKEYRDAVNERYEQERFLRG
jgi:hypothetical protein